MLNDERVKVKEKEMQMEKERNSDQNILFQRP
jgi:hypothetical protein